MSRSDKFLDKLEAICWPLLETQEAAKQSRKVSVQTGTRINTHKDNHEADGVRELGELTMATGLIATASSVAVKALDALPEATTDMLVAGSIGATVVGAVVYVLGKRD